MPTQVGNTYYGDAYSKNDIADIQAKGPGPTASQPTQLQQQRGVPMAGGMYDQQAVINSPWLGMGYTYGAGADGGSAQNQENDVFIRKNVMARNQAQTQGMQNNVAMSQEAINKQKIANALLGGGKVRTTIGPDGRQVEGPSYDPTKQFATLLGMVSGQGDDSVNINASQGGGPMGDYNQLYNQLSEMMKQRGGSYENDINQSADEAQKTQAARMQARGLGGSTLVDAGNARVNRDRLSAVNKLHDTLLGQDLGTLSTVGVEGLKAQQRGKEFNAQMKMAGSDRSMRLLQTLLGV